MAVTLRGECALAFVDWVLDHHYTKQARPKVSSDLEGPVCRCRNLHERPGPLDPIPIAWNPHYNSRKAMRVLEDYLCLEVLHDVQKVYACSSLRSLRDNPQHRDDFEQMMVKHSLTDYHLEVMFRRKKASINVTSLHGEWKQLVEKSIAEEPSSESHKALQHLFELLKAFTLSNPDVQVLKSPVYDDSNEKKFIFL